MTTYAERFRRPPTHPLLVALTMATLGSSLLLDIATRLIHGGSLSLVNLSYHLVGFGIVGGLALAVISALDLRRVGADSAEIDAALIRLAIDLSVVLLFFVNFFWRELTAFNTQTTVGQILLSIVSFGALVAGFARQLRVSATR